MGKQPSTILFKNSGQPQVCLILKTYKMKKTLFISLTVFLTLAIYACNPDKIEEELSEKQACCGEVPPMIPPPPSTDTTQNN